MSVRTPRHAVALVLALLAGCSLFSPTDALLASSGCPAGWKVCHRECVAIDNPATGCGETSCEPCEIPHAASRCQEDRCVRGSCESGWSDCDGLASNGCEQVRGEGVRACNCNGIRLTRESSIVAPTDGLAFGDREWTVELWLKIESPILEVGQILGIGGGTPEENLGVIRLKIQNNRFHCEIARQAPPPLLEDRVETPVAIPVGRWHHAACQRRGGRLELWFNGERVAEAPAVSSVAAQGHLWIGSQFAATGSWSAPVLLGPVRISEVLRYDHAFTPGTVWGLDDGTVAQYLALTPYDAQFRTLIDEARSSEGDLSGKSLIGVQPIHDDLPCE